jgi:hypothetical protein
MAADSGGGGGGGGGNSWQRGAMSRRFDGKEDTPLPAAKPVVRSDSGYHFSTRLTDIKKAPIATNIAQGDEAAAIAAMFQAQDANWDETQEKMSQFVSALVAFLRFRCSFLRSNEPSCPSLCTRHLIAYTVRRTSIEEALVVVDPPQRVPTTSKLLSTGSLIDPYRQATSAIVVARKVSLLGLHEGDNH